MWLAEGVGERDRAVITEVADRPPGSRGGGVIGVWSSHERARLVRGGGSQPYLGPRSLGVWWLRRHDDGLGVSRLRETRPLNLWRPSASDLRGRL